MPCIPSTGCRRRDGAEAVRNVLHLKPNGTSSTCSSPCLVPSEPSPHTTSNPRWVCPFPAGQGCQGEHGVVVTKWKSSAIHSHFTFQEIKCASKYSRQTVCDGAAAPVPAPRSILTPPAIARLSAFPPPPPQHSQTPLALCLPSPPPYTKGQF